MSFENDVSNSDRALQDLETAIIHGQDKHLYTAGELAILEKFTNLPKNERKLYVHLLSRKPILFRYDKSPQNYQQLLGTGFICLSNHLNKRKRFQLYVLKELYELCKVYGITKSGKKSEIIDRLLPLADPPQCFLLRYSALFERVFSKYLLQHECNWSQLIIYRIQQTNFYPYKITQCSIHWTRKALRQYQHLRHAYLSGQYPISVTQLSAPKLCNSLYRFSAARFYRKLIMSLAQQLEKNAPAEAIKLYSSLMPNHDAQLRLLALYRHHPAPYTLFEHCKAMLPQQPLWKRISQYQSLRPLCTNLKLRRGLPPRLISPKDRTLYTRRINNSAQYHYKENIYSVETLIIKMLSDHDCIVHFSENGFWTTLRHLLFLKAIFTPVSRQFPSPLQASPLDLYSQDFYSRREKLCETIFESIQAGHAITILKENQKIAQHYRIQGIDTQKHPMELLILFLEKISPDTFIPLLRFLLQNPKTTGFPDLLVYSEAPFSFPYSFPQNIHHSLFFIEVKSEYDVLRPNQRAMHHIMLEYGFHIELWKQREPKH